MISLLKDEKIIEVLSPHPVSFWPHYLFFLWYIVVGSIMYAKYDEILGWISANITSISLIQYILLIIFWWFILIIPAVIFFIVKITAKWVILFTLIAVLGTAAVAKSVVALEQIWILTAGIGALGFILTELYRRSHKYIITNKRLVMGVYMGIFGKRERELLYSNIVDVMMDQGLLGKLLNYGTIVPTTASGIGTGVDVAKVSVGVGGAAEKGGVGVGAGVAVGGERGITVPRGRSWFILYGVPDPERVKNILMEQIQKREPAQYLERQVELLEKLVEGKEGRSGE